MQHTCKKTLQNYTSVLKAPASIRGHFSRLLKFLAYSHCYLYLFHASLQITKSLQHFSPNSRWAFELGFLELNDDRNFWVLHMMRRT